MPRSLLRRAARRALSVVVVIAAVGGCASEARRTDQPARPASSSTTGSTPPPPPAEFRPAPLQWRDCDVGQCARLAVPMDHDRPGDRSIELALARVPARDPQRRIGSLLFNPGGPGASGVDLTDYVAPALPDEIRDRFDIVGWDPRGAGASTPVDCGDALDDRFAVDSAPDDPTELAALELAAQRFVAACVARTGALLRFISTDDSVRDMDVIRRALGDEQLTFLGLSYGTYLGTHYAARYPDRVRALVFDGAVDPAVPIDQVAVDQARGFDASFEEFLAWCRHESCSFHPSDPVQGYRDLQRRVEREALQVDGRDFGPTQLDLAVTALLYSGEDAYSTLARRLRDADRGDAAGLLEVYDQYVERNADGTYTPGWPSFIATSCADGPNLDVAQTEALQARARAEAPWFGAANIGLGYECAYWPYPPERTATGPVRVPTAIAIVVVGTRGDPATPFPWAEGLASELGNARLVAVAGSTHTSTLDGHECLDRILVRYFVDLDPPAPEARCD